MNATQSRQDIRKLIREQRKKLSTQEQLKASIATCSLLHDSVLFQESQHIAFYIANDGEIDPAPLMEKAFQLNKHCYLPILHTNKIGHLGFTEFQKGDALVKNKYGIPEPSNRDEIESVQLDIVFVPLVAFDINGNRLGMGKGYYDKTFEFLKDANRHKPKLIGLAHEFQRYDRINAESWDIPLDCIVTEKKIYRTKTT